MWGTSGNMTINSTSTNLCTSNPIPLTTTNAVKREIGTSQEAGVNTTHPPYAIHNG